MCILEQVVARGLLTAALLDGTQGTLMRGVRKGGGQGSAIGSAGRKLNENVT